MKELRILPGENYGYGFIPEEYLPPGKDEYWLRNKCIPEPRPAWRKLLPREMEILVKNDNYVANWDHFFVTDPFDPGLVHNSQFYGLIRLGTLRPVVLQHHDFRVPAGIRNSTVISCDIGDECAIQDCSYLSNYIIGNTVILYNIEEMQTTNHAKFGNGVLAPGEKEDVRVWIDVMNEAGGRPILPFEDMIAADAYLWAAYRDDKALVENLKTITQNQYGKERGEYGKVGSGSVIKSCGVIKDTVIGNSAYIKGANKLKNITVLSSEEEPSQIGEGVELVNGIIGYGCHIFYGSKAVRFVMGRNCNLKYGARLIHSVMGDNSTVSCCELLNNLIFPLHEQHHNNSFLIAGLIEGLSNLAAGATIGSNHNSRANDGEIRAGRGFWPGLSVTLKHPSRFASYTIISKGDYPHELDISLPFSLISYNTKEDCLEIMPAYFWMYNMYALERNVWKSRNRDKRRGKVQHIEMDYLAPDTAEEIVRAAEQLEEWLSAAAREDAGDARDKADAKDAKAPETRLHVKGLERSKRHSILLKPKKALAAYKNMLHYYALKTITDYLFEHDELGFEDLADTVKRHDRHWKKAADSGRVKDWVNMGGGIVPAFRVDELREKIGRGTIRDWETIHAVYKMWEDSYVLDKLRHAWSLLPFLTNEKGEPLGELTVTRYKEELSRLLQIKRWIVRQVYTSRAKDFRDPYRSITFRNQSEMEAVLGNVDDNPFVMYKQKELAVFEETLVKLISRL